ncbi:MAG: ROK family protein, partial [Ruminococcus sp.]|nr:ROK family protein [Candidatus Apopatosoma intestinale]
LAVFRLCGEKLGAGLSVLIDILNPERIVIGSIFARAEALLRPSMERVIAEEALPDSAACCQIVPAALGEEIGDYAALAVAFGIDRQ